MMHSPLAVCLASAAQREPMTSLWHTDYCATCRMVIAPLLGLVETAWLRGLGSATGT